MSIESNHRRISESRSPINIKKTLTRKKFKNKQLKEAYSLYSTHHLSSNVGRGQEVNGYKVRLHGLLEESHGFYSRG